jgi:hypothetical protein
MANGTGNIDCCIDSDISSDCYSVCSLASCSCSSYCYVTCNVSSSSSPPPAPPPSPPPVINLPPTLTFPLVTQTIYIGSPSTYNLLGCTDPEINECYMIPGFTPSFALLDPATMTYTFNPSSADEGTYTVTFEISDELSST